MSAPASSQAIWGGSALLPQLEALGQATELERGLFHPCLCFLSPAVVFCHLTSWWALCPWAGQTSGHL